VHRACHSSFGTSDVALRVVQHSVCALDARQSMCYSVEPTGDGNVHDHVTGGEDEV